MELIVLEGFAALFLFFSIIRPLVRGLWKLHGLVACPLLALGILVGIFPAYGFRPECVPLLFFALFLTIVNFSDFKALFFSLHSDAYRDRGLLFTLVSAVLFACTLWVAVYFVPPIDTDLSINGVKTLFVREDLHVRVYGPVEPLSNGESEDIPAADSGLAETPEQGFMQALLVNPASPAERTLTDESSLLIEQQRVQAERPLLILVPPVAGSFMVTDSVCTALRDRGFTVLSYSRVNFDSPSFDRNGMPVRRSIFGLWRLTNALTKGLRNTSGNSDGRDLEKRRMQDVEILLEELPQNKTLRDLLDGSDRNTVFLAGYGAGGAALTILAGREDFTIRYPQVRGIMAIEAPVLSSLGSDPLPVLPPVENDPVSIFYRQIYEVVRGYLPRKITHVRDIPEPVLPILFIVSDRVTEKRTGRYETVLNTLGASRNMALLAAVPGAGPFDYSGSPRYYPVLSFLFRGASQVESRDDWPELTASLIANFAAFILENTAAYDLHKDYLKKTALDNKIYLEQGGVWQIPNSRTILQP